MDWNLKQKKIKKRILAIWKCNQIRFWTNGGRAYQHHYIINQLHLHLVVFRESAVCFEFKKRMYCDWYHSREVQYKWSPLALKTVWSPREPWPHFAQPFLLSLVWVFFLKRFIKPKQSRFDICLHVDILFCHVSPPQRKEMFNLNTARVFWTTVSCDVALGRCFISFRHCGTLWHKHLHLRRQSVTQEISPWFIFCLSPAPSPSLLPSYQLNYFCQHRELKMEHSFSVASPKACCLNRRRAPSKSAFSPLHYLQCSFFFFLSVNPKPKVMLFMSSQSALDYNFLSDFRRSLFR